MERDNVDSLTTITSLLSGGDIAAARKVANSEIPFNIITKNKRKLSLINIAQIFVRDRFVDRYSGNRLIYPGALRLIAHLIPEEIPYHRNWKYSETHPIIWNLYPTLDHVIPVSRGGKDDYDNIVSTSMKRNMIKAHWTLEELGWTLLPPSKDSSWDGLMAWFLDYVNSNTKLLEIKYLSDWHNVGLKVSK